MPLQTTTTTVRVYRTAGETADARGLMAIGSCHGGEHGRWSNFVNMTSYRILEWLIGAYKVERVSSGCEVTVSQTSVRVNCHDMNDA